MDLSKKLSHYYKCDNFLYNQIFFVYLIIKIIKNYHKKRSLKFFTNFPIYSYHVFLYFLLIDFIYYLLFIIFIFFYLLFFRINQLWHLLILLIL